MSYLWLIVLGLTLRNFFLDTYYMLFHKVFGVVIANWDRTPLFYCGAVSKHKTCYFYTLKRENLRRKLTILFTKPAEEWDIFELVSFDLFDWLVKTVRMNPLFALAFTLDHFVFRSTVVRIIWSLTETVELFAVSPPTSHIWLISFPPLRTLFAIQVLFRHKILKFIRPIYVSIYKERKIC